MLRIDGVVAGYAEGEVLHGVSLVAPSASVVALLGPNGAGKTTLLRVASGTLAARAGTVSVRDSDLTNAAPHEFVAAGICHIPEGRGIFPELTVRQNLHLFSQPRREAEAVDRAVAEFPRLGDRLDQIAGTMSGGEQQMLALSRAYLRPYRAVLIDEVSLGLAPIVVDEIFASLERLARTGTALVLVEQYVDRALDLADYVALLAQGRVVFWGEPGELAHDEIYARYLGVEVGGIHPSRTGA
jgi:branched-chain amino acid transport system ATP-binding protein